MLPKPPLFFITVGLMLLLANSNALAAKKKRGVTSTLASTDTAVSDLRAKVQSLDESVRRVEAELETLKSHSPLSAAGTILNQTYFKAGLEMIWPRPRSFDFRTDPGLGAFVGLGQYLGTHHVVDISFDWDLYLAMSFRYRYEFHLAAPAITVGPVLGYKVKAAAIGPIDNFIDNPDAIKSSFFFLGGILGFPLSKGMATLELIYIFNQQQFIFCNGGVHFYL